ncbi:MAG: class I SAM-dependent methyltransferase [Erysipelotrichaceae bacterium]|nr:class I SAM-dependent methyltransferase [Erysipelotrichaceae bacterium]
MGKIKKELFNIIAPFYAWFFDSQKRLYSNIVDILYDDISSYKTIIDVGCGTGALSSALTDKGFSVTAIDPAEKMIKIASENPHNISIEFMKADVLIGLPFTDQEYDIAIASYVAHGLNKHNRELMYQEMRRLAKHLVIIHDYNDNRHWFTSFVEWIEGGDYFNFIKHPENELRDCQKELMNCFKSVRVVKVGKRANWYICVPKHDN